VRATTWIEKAGIPAVGIICTGFVLSAQAIARMLGLLSMRIVEYPPPNIGTQTREEIKGRAGIVLDHVIQALTQPAPKANMMVPIREPETRPRDIVFKGTLREVNDFFHSYGLLVTLHTCGSTREALALRGPSSRVLDLGGLTVINGITDAHAHLYPGGPWHLHRCGSCLAERWREQHRPTSPGCGEAGFGSWRARLHRGGGQPAGGGPACRGIFRAGEAGRRHSQAYRREDRRQLLQGGQRVRPARHLRGPRHAPRLQAREDRAHGFLHGLCGRAIARRGDPVLALVQSAAVIADLTPIPLP
jgi:hypothetical protein